jgi:hypothetical protein
MGKTKIAFFLLRGTSNQAATLLLFAVYVRIRSAQSKKDLCKRESTGGTGCIYEKTCCSPDYKMIGKAWTSSIEILEYYL